MHNLAQAFPFALLAEHLRELCECNATGTIMIATDQNQSARIAMQRGVIVGVAHQRLEGDEALRSIGSIRDGRCSFQPDVIIGVNGDQKLPQNSEILAALLPRSRATAEQPGRSSKRLVGGSVENRDLHSIMESELAEFAGPMAALICDDCLELHGMPTTIAELEALLDRVGAELDDPRKARDFRRRVLEIIG